MAHKGAELCRDVEDFLEWPCHGGLNETSVEAEPEGENAILLFNHTDNLFSLSLAPPHTLPLPLPPPSHCYSSPGPVKLFILYIHICQASNREATVNEKEQKRDDLEVCTWKRSSGNPGFSLHPVLSFCEFNLLYLIRMIQMPSIGTYYSTRRQMSISIPSSVDCFSGWDDIFRENFSCMLFYVFTLTTGNQRQSLK